ncbi:MAG: 16S rRNA (adenine(1518)-N(6)/adenine(1519)-N(6))-dimethyltransferase RsmA [Rhodospirillaceae bacterium]|nr:16S rRNA (adenine(1518)-N(6)/adenine(1519)-N(6))-dimethyltransferase RsmA [Rhodospirillaceae bacterium]
MSNDSFDGLVPLREIVSNFDLAAQKSLGQNFLMDMNLTYRIARTAGDLSKINVIEIGPGPGGLTRAILKCGAKKVISIERDERCIDALRYISDEFPDRFQLIHGDALEQDIIKLAPAPRRIMANLPYNVATPLLISWLKRAKEFEGMTLMFQKEVADRLVAKPRTKAYGRLSVMTGWLCEVKCEFNIDPKAFTPAPKVISTVVTLKPRAQPLASASWNAMEHVVATAFGQRRKMLRQSLKPLELDLASLGISETSRAEELEVEDFAKLARAFAEKT